jgi:hypothetical protein
MVAFVFPVLRGDAAARRLTAQPIDGADLGPAHCCASATDANFHHATEMK